jgi:hypothetical protein
MPEPLLTLEEAADYLRLTLSALYTQRHRGEKRSGFASAERFFTGRQTSSAFSRSVSPRRSPRTATDGVFG